MKVANQNTAVLALTEKAKIISETYDGPEIESSKILRDRYETLAWNVEVCTFN